jgi:hypothetical protein
MTDEYRTIPALMLKDTDYQQFLHGEDRIYSVQDALTLCDAMEEVVAVWKDGLEAFNLESQDEKASQAYGQIALVRLCFMDLARKQPEVPQKEAEEALALLATAFLPLARSYSNTPILSQWYLTIPLRVAGAYSRLRRGR